MELVGEEKRIQALYSELRLADEQTTPSFAGVWNRAQPKAIRTRIAYKLSFVTAAALLVCALVSFAWWWKHWQQNPDAVATAPPGRATGEVKVVIENEKVNWPKPISKNDRRGAKARALKLISRREALLVAANRRVKPEVKTIASWQSPTVMLLDSQSDELLKSLPQLNRTVDELKSFLPSQPK
jgi:hypothetical protein